MKRLHIGTHSIHADDDSRRCCIAAHNPPRTPAWNVPFSRSLHTAQWVRLIASSTHRRVSYRDAVHQEPVSPPSNAYGRDVRAASPTPTSARHKLTVHSQPRDVENSVPDSWTDQDRVRVGEPRTGTPGWTLRRFRPRLRSEELAPVRRLAPRRLGGCRAMAMTVMRDHDRARARARLHPALKASVRAACAPARRRRATQRLGSSRPPTGPSAPRGAASARLPRSSAPPWQDRDGCCVVGFELGSRPPWPQPASVCAHRPPGPAAATC